MPARGGHGKRWVATRQPAAPNNLVQCRPRGTQRASARARERWSRAASRIAARKHFSTCRAAPAHPARATHDATVAWTFDTVGVTRRRRWRAGARRTRERGGRRRPHHAQHSIQLANRRDRRDRRRGSRSGGRRAHGRRRRRSGGETGWHRARGARRSRTPDRAARAAAATRSMTSTCRMIPFTPP